MLVELDVVEQRYQAVLEVLHQGVSVTDVARRFGVTRQTVHRWLRQYANGGLGALADRSSKPGSCPHQMDPRIEARIVELRREHLGWGPRSIETQLRREGVVPLPGRSSIYRALIRHKLIEPARRRRRREDYKRWERSKAMELWQMDVMGGVYLADGTELKAVTGIDDHSRFCVCARLVHRATAKPVCAALAEAMRTHGVPAGVLTDNGMVFTGKFGPGKGLVLFDRICHENGIKHLLTKPFSPTTTGKIERLHKTMRSEHFRVVGPFDTIEQAQAALDGWVFDYNHQRAHQSIGDRPPIDRFQLARQASDDEVVDVDDAPELVEAKGPPRITRRVGDHGRISLAGHHYLAGRWLAGEVVEIELSDGLVEIWHDGVLCETHARHHPSSKTPKEVVQRNVSRRARDATIGMTVTRVVDSSGNISFAGHGYHVPRRFIRRQLDVAIVGNNMQFSVGGEVVKISPIRHDRTKEHGAFANPTGRPRKARAV